GKNWMAQATNNLATFFDIVFTDNVAGWAVGTQGAMFQTLNGGQVWVDHTRSCGSPCIKPADLVKVQFSNALVGRIVGERGTILETRDAGFTWQELEPINSETLYGLSIPDSSQGFAVGDHGTILHFLSPHSNP
ncbi:MAG: YCF48-related protein, partial [Nitrospirota bacterium]|nr:YCF48-related protein [Nitrospirota bacterium]